MKTNIVVKISIIGTIVDLIVMIYFLFEKNHDNALIFLISAALWAFSAFVWSKDPDDV